MLLTDIAFLFFLLVVWNWSWLWANQVKKVTVLPVISLPLVVEAKTFCPVWTHCLVCLWVIQHMLHNRHKFSDCVIKLLVNFILVTENGIFVCNIGHFLNLWFELTGWLCRTVVFCSSATHKSFTELQALDSHETEWLSSSNKDYLAIHHSLRMFISLYDKVTKQRNKANAIATTNLQHTENKTVVFDLSEQY